MESVNTCLLATLSSRMPNQGTGEPLRSEFDIFRAGV